MKMITTHVAIIVTMIATAEVVAADIEVAIVAAARDVTIVAMNKMAGTTSTIIKTVKMYKKFVNRVVLKGVCKLLFSKTDKCMH